MKRRGKERDIVVGQQGSFSGRISGHRLTCNGTDHVNTQVMAATTRVAEMNRKTKEIRMVLKEKYNR